MIFFGAKRPTDDPEWMSYVNSLKKPPISTYVLGANNAQHSNYFTEKDGYELADNITYLGNYGVITMTPDNEPTAEPLSVCYLSGVEALSKEALDHTFTEKDARSLVQSVQKSHPRGVDILITSSWPAGIQNYVGEKEKVEAFCGQGPQSELISFVAAAIKPRYHFSSLHQCHFERFPYRNHIILREKNKHVTRFISLASVANAEKQKWLYAFSLISLKSLPELELSEQPAGTTENPYQEVLIRRAARRKAEKRKIGAGGSGEGGDPKTGIQSYRWDVELMAQDHESMQNFDRNAPLSAKVKDRGTDFTCWFCLGSEKVEKHLVISIGEHAYMTLAKGGLNNQHVLILPVSHQGSSLDCLPECTEEIKMYKEALVKFYRQKHQKAVVFFERNYRSDHYQLQCCPVPEDCIPHVADTFRDEAISMSHSKPAGGKRGKPGKRGGTAKKGEELSLAFTTLEPEVRLDDILTSDTPYFYAEIPDTKERLIHKIESWFPLQFGRQVLASPDILNNPSLVDWKRCTLEKEEETKICEKLRQEFSPFDPMT